MRFKTLFAVCALFGSLFQSSPSLSETLRTAWLGEHEAFLTWYAKEKGWDKEAGLDIIMLRFDSGKSLIEDAMDNSSGVRINGEGISFRRVHHVAIGRIASDILALLHHLHLSRGSLHR